MRRRQTIPVAVALSLLLLVTTGCPPTGHFGRYIIINNTGETIEDLTVSSEHGEAKTWPVTEVDQAWIKSRGGGYNIAVSWKANDGTKYNVTFSIKDEAKGHCKKDLIMEIRGRGCRVEIG
jgi:hypothetical protein